MVGWGGRGKWLGVDGELELGRNTDVLWVIER